MLVIPVLTFFSLWKRAKKEPKKYDRQDKEVNCFIGTLFAVILSVGIGFSLHGVCHRLFEYSSPVCLEYVASVPTQSHWTRPNNRFIEIPEGFPNFIIQDISWYGRSDVLLRDGLVLGTHSSSDYILLPEKGKYSKDSVAFYVYTYEKWGPFSVPGFMREGHACFGEPELIKRGRCKTEVEVK